MDTLQCAIVLGKLERFEWEVGQRLKVGLRYNELLEGKVSVVAQRLDRTSVFAQYTVFTENREHLQGRLTAAGIPTAVHYPVPLNEQPAYQHLCCPNCTPISEQHAGQVISFPMSADLTPQDQDKIVRVVMEAVA